MFQWSKLQWVVCLISGGLFLGSIPACSGQNPSQGAFLPQNGLPPGGLAPTALSGLDPSTQTPVQNTSANSQSGVSVDASQIIPQRCAYCHSAQPNANSGFTQAPMGLAFDTQTEILSHLDQIKTAVLVRKNMPLQFNMSDQERALLGQWLDQLSAQAQTSAGTTPVAQATAPPAPQTEASPLPTVLPDAPVADSSTDSTAFMTVMTQKCAYCHSVQPNPASGYPSAPRALTLDTLDEVNANLSKIQTYVANGSMPLSPISLTESEKSQILAWNPDAATGSGDNLTLPDLGSGLGSDPNADPTASAAPLAAPEIITQKCAYCHSSNPDPSSGYTKAPGGFFFGVKLDTEAEMQDQHDDIQKEVSKGNMPPSNGPITLTSEERQTILDWCDQQEAAEGTSWWQRLF